MQKRYLRVCCALRNKLSTGGYWVGTLAIWNNLGSAWGGTFAGVGGRYLSLLLGGRRLQGVLRQQSPSKRCQC